MKESRSAFSTAAIVILIAVSVWAYALEACATDEPAGFGYFSLVWRRYKRHLHKPISFYKAMSKGRLSGFLLEQGLILLVIGTVIATFV